MCNSKPAFRFRHLLGTDAKPDQCYQDLRPSTAGSETNIIKCSSLFWAIPWAGAGGSVFVRKWDAVGRVEPMPHMLQGHKGEVLDIDFNPFAPNVIATGSDDTTIKVWSVPAEGIAAPVTASDYTLEGHQKKVTLVNWHPTASNVLMSCSADNTIKGASCSPASHITSHHTPASFSIVSHLTSHHIAPMHRYPS